MQQADGQLESAMITLWPLLHDEPNNTHYLVMAADLEMSLYQSQRSYLNHVSNKRTLALLERLLEVEVDNKARIYRRIAQVYAMEWDYVTSLKFLEQAAESGTQGEKNGATSDALWIEAAQTAIEIQEFGKARGYLLKALAQNPQNASARQFLQDLPILEMSPLYLVGED